MRSKIRGPARGRGTDGAGRGRLIFVLGGASSGKSAFALSLARTGKGARRRAFVATAEARDAEMAARIARHRAERDEGWETAEVPVAVADWLRAKGTAYDSIVVDCLTLWLSNLGGAGLEDGLLSRSVEEVVTGARATRRRVIFVSNELGLGLVPADPASRQFRELAGRMHQQVAAAADEVYLVVAGLPQRLK